MLNKEEIEKAKEILNKLKNYKVLVGGGFVEILTDEEKDAIETLLQYIKELEADNYELNNRLNEYIEERSKLIDKMKGDRMEQLDDYVIYLIETYLKELGALEDE